MGPARAPLSSHARKASRCENRWEEARAVPRQNAGLPTGEAANLGVAALRTPRICRVWRADERIDGVRRGRREDARTVEGGLGAGRTNRAHRAKRYRRRQWREV